MIDPQDPHTRDMFEQDESVARAILEEYNFLKGEVAYHAHQYYVLSAPELSDAEYDALYRRLEDFEATYPDMVTDDSPTRKVGYIVVGGLKPVKLETPMLSIHSAMNRNETMVFLDRITKEHADVDFVYEPKYDGLSLEIFYKNGILIQASTRGDGYVGEDVTHNVRMISNIPLRLSRAIDLKVRGEVIVKHSDFEKINNEARAAGLKGYANPRALASGSLRLLDSSESQKRNLRFMAFGLDSIFSARSMGLNAQSEVIRFLRDDMGFELSADIELANLAAMDDIYADFEKKREVKGFGFDLDGMVIKVDRFDIQEALGWNHREPKWAVAYKFSPERAPALLEGIEVQVGRTGQMTPVAKIRPTFVGGTTISSITLHNQAQVDLKDVRIGDTVIVQRAGDTIPEIVGVDLSKRPASAKPYILPSHCPVCGHSAIKDGSASKCSNSACEAKKLNRLLHFVSRKAMDIDNFGEATMIAMCERFPIHQTADLFDLIGKEDEIAELSGFGKVSACNLTSALAKSVQDLTLSKFIYAMGIDNVGEGTSGRLAEHFNSLEKLSTATYDELVEIPDIGPLTAQSIIDFFSNEEELENISRMLPNITFAISKKPTAALKNANLSGLNVCITGTLPFTRADVFSMIESCGGTPSTDVNKKTNILVVGEAAGGKLAKAEKLGIKIIGFSELQTMMEPPAATRGRRPGA